MKIRAAHSTAVALSFLTIVAYAPRARALDDANTRSTAVQLFDEAEALFAKNQVADACPKYAESFHLDPQLGVLIYLAECYEKNNQLASAWGSFREAEEMAAKRGDSRLAHAHERAVALEPRLDRLAVMVTGSARVPNLQILRDGMLVAETLWNSGVLVDSGKHRLEARAEGYLPWKSEVNVVGDGVSQSVSVPKLDIDPAAAAGSSGAGESSPASSNRIAAIAIGGVGIVGLGVGGFFGLSAQSSYSDSRPLCNDGNVCTSRGTDLRNSAKSKALVSTIAVGAGVAALATGVVLWFISPKAKEQPPQSARGWRVAPDEHAWGIDLSTAF